MASQLILTADDSTGIEFSSSNSFMVFFETFTAGWFLEFSRQGADTPRWVKWNERAFTSADGDEYLLVPGIEDVVFRLNGGTTGAVAYRTGAKISIFR